MEYSLEILVLETKPNSRFWTWWKPKFPAHAKSLCCVCCLFLSPFGSWFRWRWNQTCAVWEYFAVLAAAAEACGTERVNALRPGRPISAARRSPSATSSGPSTENSDPGLFVILAEHTPPGSSPALPWTTCWLLRRALVYLTAIRGHCCPPTPPTHTQKPRLFFFFLRVVDPSGGNKRRSTGRVQTR